MNVKEEKESNKRKTERIQEREYWWRLMGVNTDVQKLGAFGNSGITVIRQMFDQ